MLPAATNASSFEPTPKRVFVTAQQQSKAGQANNLARRDPGVKFEQCVRPLLYQVKQKPPLPDDLVAGGPPSDVASNSVHGGLADDASATDRLRRAAHWLLLARAVLPFSDSYRQTIPDVSDEEAGAAGHAAARARATTLFDDTLRGAIAAGCFGAQDGGHRVDPSSSPSAAMTAVLPPWFRDGAFVSLVRRPSSGNALACALMHRCWQLVEGGGGSGGGAAAQDPHDAAAAAPQPPQSMRRADVAREVWRLGVAVFSSLYLGYSSIDELADQYAVMAPPVAHDACDPRESQNAAASSPLPPSLSPRFHAPLLPLDDRSGSVGMRLLCCGLPGGDGGDVDGAGQARHGQTTSRVVRAVLKLAASGSSCAAGDHAVKRRLYQPVLERASRFGSYLQDAILAAAGKGDDENASQLRSMLRRLQIGSALEGAMFACDVVILVVGSPDGRDGDVQHDDSGDGTLSLRPNAVQGAESGNAVADRDDDDDDDADRGVESGEESSIGCDDHQQQRGGIGSAAAHDDLRAPQRTVSFWDSDYVFVYRAVLGELLVLSSIQRNWPVLSDDTKSLILEHAGRLMRSCLSVLLTSQAKLQSVMSADCSAVLRMVSLMYTSVVETTQARQPGCRFFAAASIPLRLQPTVVCAAVLGMGSGPPHHQRHATRQCCVPPPLQTLVLPSRLGGVGEAPEPAPAADFWRLSRFRLTEASRLRLLSGIETTLVRDSHARRRRLWLKRHPPGPHQPPEATIGVNVDAADPAWAHVKAQWLLLRERIVWDVTAGRLPVTVLIDGANVGYFGLSAWYAVAKAAQLEERWARTGGDSSGMNIKEYMRLHPAEFESTTRRRQGQGTDVAPNLEVVDAVIAAVCRAFGIASCACPPGGAAAATFPSSHAKGSSSPPVRLRFVVVLHARHVDPDGLTAANRSIVQSWETQRDTAMAERDPPPPSAVTIDLLVSPAGYNDDLVWMYGGIFVSNTAPAVATPISRSSSSLHPPPVPSPSPPPVFVVSNDIMRDHTRGLFRDADFLRWRVATKVKYGCLFSESSGSRPDERASSTTAMPTTPTTKHFTATLRWPPTECHCPQLLTGTSVQEVGSHHEGVTTTIIIGSHINEKGQPPTRGGWDHIQEYLSHVGWVRSTAADPGTSMVEPQRGAAPVDAAELIAQLPPLRFRLAVPFVAGAVRQSTSQVGLCSFPQDDSRANATGAGKRPRTTATDSALTLPEAGDASRETADLLAKLAEAAGGVAVRKRDVTVLQPESLCDGSLPVDGWLVLASST